MARPPRSYRPGTLLRGIKPPRCTSAELFFSCCAGVAALPALANCNERRGAAGKGLGTTIKYLRQTTSGAAGYGLGAAIKYLRHTTSGGAGNGLDNKIKHLRSTPRGAADSSLGAAMKYLRRTTSAAANNSLSTMITPPCSVAAFVVNSERHTGARPSVRLCVGPELARCVHNTSLYVVSLFRHVLTLPCELTEIVGNPLAHIKPEL